MLQSQGDVVGGDGEEALQLWVSIQVGSVGLQEGPQGATAHILHDEDVRLCMMRGRTGIYSVGSLLLPVEKNNGFKDSFVLAEGGSLCMKVSHPQRCSSPVTEGCSCGAPVSS